MGEIEAADEREAVEKVAKEIWQHATSLSPTNDVISASPRNKGKAVAIHNGGANVLTRRHARCSGNLHEKATD
jgi:hypothetical protein